MSAPGTTPGPWRVEVQDETEAEGDTLEVYVCSEATVCTATVVATMGTTRWIKPEATLANAHLIAAAPDLYEALEGWQRLHADMVAAGGAEAPFPEHELRGWAERQTALMKATDSALAKARDEA